MTGNKWQHSGQPPEDGHEPTPDPTSPCGMLMYRDGKKPYVCTSVDSNSIHRMWPIEPHHAYVPTLCQTCHHAIRPAP